MLYCPSVGSAPLLTHEFVRGTKKFDALFADEDSDTNPESDG